jgi:hypothetical protein
VRSQVKEDQKYKKKKTFVNFKRAVWHRSFYELLDLVQQYSRTGCWVHCGDNIDRRFFPAILILSADYEEQYVVHYLTMASTN